MRRILAILLLAGLPLAGRADGVASDPHWRIAASGQLELGSQPSSWCAGSNTAMSITGNILLSDHAIGFAGGVSEALGFAAAVASWPDDAEPVDDTAAEIFKVTAPQTLKLLGGNSFAPAWLVVFPGPVAAPAGGRALTIYEYDGAAEPTPATPVDGTYSYTPGPC